MVDIGGLEMEMWPRGFQDETVTGFRRGRGHYARSGQREGGMWKKIALRYV
jgi:hypothetical protein